MLAVTIRSHGGPEAVLLEEMPRPAVEGPDDVVVSLRTAAMNHLDLFVVGGLPGLKPRFPHVLGADGAGIVEAVGSAVSRVAVGDRVLLDPGVSCHACEYCVAGEQSLCSTYRLLGEHLPGTFAEAVRVPQWNAYRLPDGVAWADAAAYPLVHLTAWRMLTTRAAVRPGETVLIWGIGGGVALAALGVAKLLGAVAVVTSSSDAKLAKARALGADMALNHAVADVPREVRRFTGGRGADVVVDSVGEATWERSLRALAPGGRLVTCGATTGPNPEEEIRQIFWKQITILGSTMSNDREFRALYSAVAAGRLTPRIDRVFPLALAREAYERLEAGRQHGKIILVTPSAERRWPDGD